MQDVFYLFVTFAFFALTGWLVEFAGRLETGEKEEGKP